MGRPKKVLGHVEVNNITTKTIVDSNVLELRAELDKLGIHFEESDSVIDLAKKLSKEAQRLNSEKVLSEVNSVENKLKHYGLRSNLKDKELLTRLFTIGVPEFYLEPFRDRKNPRGAPYYIFNDIDIQLNDDELWSRVRSCEYTPVDFYQTMSKYSKQHEVKLRG